MNAKYNSPRKKFNWKILLIFILIFSSTFTLLDAFIIPKAYAVVAQDASEYLTESYLISGDEIDSSTVVADSDVSQSVTANSLDDQILISQTDPVLTDLSYVDDNITIQIEKINENGVVFYTADVVISDVSFLKTAFADNTYGKNITETTSDMADDHNAIFAINGDYYGFRDTGLVIRNGILYRDISGGPSGDQSLVVDYEGNLELVDTNELSGESLIEKGILQGFTFGPVLVEDGQPTSSYSTDVSLKANPRTAIGQISALHYLFIVVEGRSNTSSGMTLEKLAQEFIKRGASIAYNLDGGGSSAMVLNGVLINTPAEKRNTGERSISDIIYIGY